MQKQSQQLFKVTEEKLKQNCPPRKTIKRFQHSKRKLFPPNFLLPLVVQHNYSFLHFAWAHHQAFPGMAIEGLSISAKESSAPGVRIQVQVDVTLRGSCNRPGRTLTACRPFVFCGFPLELCCFRGFVDRFIAEVDCRKLLVYFLVYFLGECRKIQSL